MNALSLRSRLLAGLSIVAVMLVSVAILITTMTRNQLRNQVDEQLSSAAHADARIAGFGDGELFPQPEPDPSREWQQGRGSSAPERLSNLYEGILLPDGTLQTIFEPNLREKHFSEPVVSLEDAERSKKIFTTESENGNTRYRVSISPVGDNYIVRAIPLNDVDETVQRMIALQAVGLAAILALLSAVAWWVIHLGIRPIKEMTTTARQMAGSDLDTRLPEPTSTGTESSELAITLNQMLDRVQGAVAKQSRSEERLRQFVADASHELRTPVTTIRGFAELYRHGGLADPDSLSDAMRRTEQESMRMGRLVEDMLDLAKLDQERPIRYEPLDLSRLVQDSVLDAKATAPERPITSDIANSIALRGDDDRLRQVLGNIIGNAIVHTPDGTPVSVTATSDGDRATVTIADEGDGMDADAASRMTERFYRADPSRSRERGGSGLGMAITEAIIKAHGGQIVVDSQPGVGTEISIELPLNNPAAVTTTPES